MSVSSRNRFLASCIACILPLAACCLRADELQMQNGDRYQGKILFVSSNAVVLQSDVLGKVTLPRAKVSALTFGSGVTTNTSASAAALPPIPQTSATTNTDLSAALRNLGSNTNFIEQVRAQMLTGADPAASQKYDELVGGLLSGKLSVNDLRNQAKTSIDQINELKRELGPEAGDSLDSYLSILQSFVNETAPATPAAPAVNTPATAPVRTSPQPQQSR